MIALDARIAACRKCHSRGFLDEEESVPIVRDPEPDGRVPKILLIGQAPGLKATIEGRPFAGISGERLRAWFEQGGIPKEDFWRKIHFAAVTRCYPGRLIGAKGDRVPSIEEQALCRPWLDELKAVVRPRIVLLLGLLAIRSTIGPVPSLSSVVGTGTIDDDGVRFLPLPHPSGVSRWMNDPRNAEAVDRGLAILAAWVEELGI